MTITLKTARCIQFMPHEVACVECFKCSRLYIKDAPKQAWQYPPKPNSDGTCPSFLQEVK